MTHPLIYPDEEGLSERRKTFLTALDTDMSFFVSALVKLLLDFLETGAVVKAVRLC